MISLNENATSWAVIGWPSDQVRSSRITTLSYRPSLLVCHDLTYSFAANGIMAQSKPNKLNDVRPEISNFRYAVRQERIHRAQVGDERHGSWWRPN